MAKILVVDDEPNIRRLFRDELEEEGHKIEQAGDGAEALAEVERTNCDLVILDLRMPEMNGLECLEKIRERRPGLPVIVCTAVRGVESDYELWSSHVSAILSKPVDLELLKTEIDKVLAEAER
jgi:DNA-binding NtrC family response regulator